MSFAPLAAASFASFTISEVLYAQSATCRSGVAAAILINPSRIGDAPSSGIVQIELVYLFLRVYAREMPSEENLCTHKTGYAKRASGMLFPSEELPPAGGGSSPYPRRMGKRVDTYGFYPLDSRFPLFLNLTQTRDRRPLRNGERQRSFSTVGAHSVRPFLYLYAVSDTILLHISATPRRRDIPVSRNSFIWILRTAPANFICPCYSFVHMVGENESQNEKMENETISFSIFHFQLLTDRQPESQTHPFHPDASDNALSLPRSRRRAAAQRSGSG